MIRIVFVDDEPMILQGLKRALRLYRKEWDMVFVNSGEEALELLSRKPADIIVSDMLMPGMDGAMLLAKVKEQHPGTIRIVLTGHTELEVALRTIPIAHNFLNKPCEAEVIKEIIDRAVELQSMLQDKQLKRKIDEMNGLPAVPKTYSQLEAALRREEASIDEVAEIIERDMAIASKILRTVNSGFFGSSRQVSDIRSAVNYLGVNLLETIVLSVEIFQKELYTSISSAYSIEEEQRHGLLVAKIASSICPERAYSNQAFMAGLLHDVGKLVLASQEPDYFAEVLEIMAAEQMSFYHAEQVLRRYTHAEIGAYLPSLWGLPYPIIEAIAHHHEPRRVLEHRRLGLPGVVYIANMLAHKVTDQTENDEQLFGDKDQACLEELGVLEELPAWESIAAREVELIQEVL